MSLKITLEQYKQAIGGSGSRWIGHELPTSTKTNTKWMCENGHTFYATYDNIVRRGSGCRECSGFKKKAADDYRKLKDRTNIEWLGEDLPANALTKTTWMCAKGHVFQSTYVAINRGHGCPYCAGNARKTIEDYKDIIGRDGLRWIGKTLPKYTDTLTSWQCQAGHIVKSRYDDVLQGKGCRICYGNRRFKTVEDYRTVKGKDGARWDGAKLPPNVMGKTRWICDQGHTWQARYNDIVYNNQGCPKCAGSKGEHKIAEILDALGVKYERERKVFGLVDKYPLRFDFVLESIKVIIEYHGQQHYEETTWFKSIPLERRQYLDKLKQDWAIQNGYKIIVIPYWDYDSLDLTFIKQLIAGQRSPSPPSGLRSFQSS
ncbi:MAG: hypothetical protein KJ077_08230 [Anaerolineae bacterium]|nr:hypothetical protein [Anaerolineae bacterium]